MRRKLVVLAMVALLLLLATPLAQAITFGQPDGNLQPNVGAMLLEDRNGNWFEECTGTLIAPTVFLTASHCVSWLPTPRWSLDDVWVTFDPVISASSTVYHGTAVPNPNYGHDAHDANDVAVILLDVPVGLPLAQLPTAGLLDQMQADHLLKDQMFVTVGYGTVRDDPTHAWQTFQDNAERKYVEQGFQALKPFWIQLSMNPATGNGGTCYGDSGGPHFLAGTNIIAAITVTGDRYCRATDVDYRMDTVSARAFLGQFVPLP
jgi:secreted trypsin-like serine protease